MSKSLKEVEQQILELSPEDKESLAHRLYIEIESMNPDIEKSWIDESERRLQELINGKVKGIPAKEVFKRVRVSLNEQKRNISSSASESNPIREKNIRGSVILKFPYTIFYAKIDTVIYIVAVAHHRQHPDYWKDRMKDIPE